MALTALTGLPVLVSCLILPKSRYFHARAEENFHDQSCGKMPTDLSPLPPMEAFFISGNFVKIHFVSASKIEKSFETFL